MVFNSSKYRIPDFPALMAASKFVKPTPFGAATPNPVITTLLLMFNIYKFLKKPKISRHSELDSESAESWHNGDLVGKIALLRPKDSESSSE